MAEPDVEPDAASGPSESTFSLAGEDHTLGNAIRYMLNRHPGVVFAGYSVPHPSDEVVNVCVQTSGQLSAQQALREAVTDLALVCGHVSDVFDEAVKAYRGRTGGGGAAAGAGAPESGAAAGAAARPAGAGMQEMSESD